MTSRISGSFITHRLALAAALAASGAAQSAVVGTGSLGIYPGAAVPIGPGNTDLGNSGLIVGSGAAGTLRVDGGSLLSAGALIGASGAANITGEVVLTGAGSRISLSGDLIANGWLNRLEVAAWGRGTLTVADGASLDTTVNLDACRTNSYCSTFVGNFAGSDATMTVTGAGSSVSLLRGMLVGGVAVFAPPQASFTAGTPGGATTGRVNVLAGASLRTDYAQLGLAPGGTNATGRERSFADVLVDGTGSIWRVTGSTITADNQAAYISTATNKNAWATLAVSNGATLQVEGSGNAYTGVNLTSGGGRTDASITGAGSSISFTAQSGSLQVGRSLGSATLDVTAGGQVSHAWYVSVGRDGSFGTLNVQGAGSVVHVDNTATAAANGVSGAAFLDIGRGGGNGTVNVGTGGRIEVIATTSTTNGVGMNLGRDAASAGTLNISSGGTVFVSAASVAPNTAGEALNPFVRIGRDGSGTLNISGGGKLLVEGNAVSTVTNTRRTSLFIGGAGDTTIGGKGTATVTGLGSEMRVSGSDAYIGVGHGPQAVGNLSVNSQASIAATILGVGNYGGTGVVKFDNAAVNLSGQYTGNGEFGAALVIGAGNGAVGNVTASNGTVIRISNAGSNGGGVSLGGSRTLTGGDGSLSMTGASLIVDIPGSNGGMSVGRSGSGLLRMQGGSSIDLGANQLVVARDSGSDGTVIATGGSTIHAGWVGVGRRLDTTTGQTFDGGTATMVLNGATLTAENVVIGTNGYLGGTAGSINVSGSVVNYGIFSPGSSPGLFSIDGNYTAGAGSRLILEVQADGQGGYNTDHVLFTQGKSIDLAAMSVEFRFLGNTDPNSFLASGKFDIDSFVALQNAAGQQTALADAAYAGVRFTASADSYVITGFSYAAGGGAVFTATPVPEPGSAALLAAGVAVLALLGRRRRSGGRAQG